MVSGKTDDSFHENEEIGVNNLNSEKVTKLIDN